MNATKEKFFRATHGDSLEKQIGNTPLLRLRRIAQGGPDDVELGYASK